MTFNRADFYDAELRRHNEHFRAVLDIGPSDRVLDIGCGAGQTSRQAAGAASVLGVDLSQEMLQVARRRTAEGGLRNVRYELGDAQVLAFPAAHFDLCISRFGVMFFADPLAAFANIGRAMRPGGRLALMVWQSHHRNEWATAIQGALAPSAGPSRDAAMFSLGEPAPVTRMLVRAGFASVHFAEVHEPVFYGPTIDAAHAALSELFLPKEAPAGMSLGGEEARHRLRALVSAHMGPEGVLFDSRAWIVTAKRAA